VVGSEGGEEAVVSNGTDEIVTLFDLEELLYRSLAVADPDFLHEVVLDELLGMEVILAVCFFIRVAVCETGLAELVADHEHDV